MSAHGTSLSFLERQLLISHYQGLIRQASDAEERTLLGQKITILRSGYEACYQGLLDIELPDDLDAVGLSVADCTFVARVLDVFEAVATYARDNPSDTEVLTHPCAKFHGFNPVHEEKMLQLAEFWVGEQGRWSILNQNGGIPHSPIETSAKYRTLVDRWEKVPYLQRGVPVRREMLMSVLNTDTQV